MANVVQRGMICSLEYVFDHSRQIVLSHLIKAESNRPIYHAEASYNAEDFSLFADGEEICLYLTLRSSPAQCVNNSLCGSPTRTF
ncbi:hypothetical protein M513_06880 [Trichuris suis]|uniref:Uncharacterized protein n=1 Tax=Trichuris suis TaxID=68888 RepID=A0A085M521_9BILA|nr:hypothetical protein M513_06880 [Trichuris suis]